MAGFCERKDKLMPTGYTAKLYEGEDQSFEDFAMSCARAFGALILMRDDPQDAPIPEFEPSDYYKRQQNEAYAELARIEAMTDEDVRAAVEYERQEYEQRRQDDKRKREGMKARYEAMLAKVEAWEPPTSEHLGLKEFMVQQLRDSIDFDCGMDYYPPAPTYDPGVGWKATKVAEQRQRIDRAKKEYAEEVDRTNQRNAWVRALRDSLGQKVG